MNPLLQFLSGRKTHLIVALGILLWLANENGWIRVPETLLQGLNPIVLLSLSALRAGVAKTNNPTNPNQP